MPQQVLADPETDGNARATQPSEFVLVRTEERNIAVQTKIRDIVMHAECNRSLMDRRKFHDRMGKQIAGPMQFQHRTETPL